MEDLENKEDIEETEECIDWEESEKEGVIVKKQRKKINREVKKYGNLYSNINQPKLVDNNSSFSTSSIRLSIGWYIGGTIFFIFLMGIIMLLYCLTHIIDYNNTFVFALSNSLCGFAYIVLPLIFYLSIRKKVAKENYKKKNFYGSILIALQMILAFTWLLIVSLLLGTSTCIIASIIFLIIFVIIAILIIVNPELADAFIELIDLLLHIFQ